MSYIDAGYAIALGVLALYAVVLWRRRGRAERLAASLGPAESTGRGGAQENPGSKPGSSPGEDGERGERTEMPGALRGPA